MQYSIQINFDAKVDNQEQDQPLFMLLIRHYSPLLFLEHRNQRTSRLCAAIPGMAGGLVSMDRQPVAEGSGGRWAQLSRARARSKHLYDGRHGRHAPDQAVRYRPGAHQVSCTWH